MILDSYDRQNGQTTLLYLWRQYNNSIVLAVKYQKYNINHSYLVYKRARLTLHEHSDELQDKQMRELEEFF